jgi:hypothetical protein
VQKIAVFAHLVLKNCTNRFRDYSGKKYIYNMELRRSLIAQVKAEVVAWEMDQTNYEADGTIEN